MFARKQIGNIINIVSSSGSGSSNSSSSLPARNRHVTDPSLISVSTSNKMSLPSRRASASNVIS
jgi:hypothetical protein